MKEKASDYTKDFIESLDSSDLFDKIDKSRTKITIRTALEEVRRNLIANVMPDVFVKMYPEEQVYYLNSDEITDYRKFDKKTSVLAKWFASCRENYEYVVWSEGTCYLVDMIKLLKDLPQTEDISELRDILKERLKKLIVDGSGAGCDIVYCPKDKHGIDYIEPKDTEPYWYKIYQSWELAAEIKERLEEDANQQICSESEFVQRYFDYDSYRRDAEIESSPAEILFFDEVEEEHCLEFAGQEYSIFEFRNDR